MPSQRAIPSKTLTGDYVLARFDDTSILLDQSCVSGVQVLDGPLASSEHPGLFEYAGEDETIPAVAPTRQFALLPAVPESRRFLLVLSIDGASLGVACDAVQVLPACNFDNRPLPIIMRLQKSPVRYMVEVHEHLAFYCDAAHLFAVFTDMEYEHV